MQGAVASGIAGYGSSAAAAGKGFYDFAPSGSARLLHMTDTHAQLLPIHFREPNVNMGIGAANGRVPHLVGKNLLAAIGDTSPQMAHALTYLDFTEASEKYGRVGGFAHLSTLVKKMRELF